MLTKIPILRSLVKLHARKIDIVETVEQCEKIAEKLEKYLKHYFKYLIELFI